MRSPPPASPAPLGEDTSDHGAPDPREELLARLRAQVLGGKRVVTLLAALTPAERALVTDGDKAGLTVEQRKVEAQGKGGGGADPR